MPLFIEFEFAFALQIAARATSTVLFTIAIGGNVCPTFKAFRIYLAGGAWAFTAWFSDLARPIRCGRSLNLRIFGFLDGVWRESRVSLHVDDTDEGWYELLGTRDESTAWLRSVRIPGGAGRWQGMLIVASLR
jgi:hypothetical protein